MMTPMGKQRALTAAVSAGTAVLLAAGCSSGGGSGSDRTAPAQAASSPAPVTRATASAATVSDSVTKAPPFPGGKVVARAANVAGNRELDIKGGVGSGILSVQVHCEGKGRLTVAVEPLGVSFPFACEAGRVSAIGNEFDLKRPHTPGTVRVTASAGVRWAITVGRQDGAGRSAS